MNTKLITILTLGALPLVGAAMPTKAELDKVSPVVMDLMRPDQEALKAGKKTKSEVAAAALDLVAKADGEAAKLLLTKGAYNLYVRDGDFEKAIETLKSFREIVPDMEPQYLANIIESSLRTISRKNGGQLYRLLAETRTLARYRDELKKLEAQAKKDASDKTLQLKLAEHYAVLGDWPKALDAFAKSSDRKAAEAAKAETVGVMTPVDAASSPRQKENNPSIKSAADYWWNYSTRKAPEFEKPFRQHAARLYEKAIASGELVGLNKVQADRRIEEANALGETVYEAPATKDGLYCVIDLSGGPNAKHYPVSYLSAIPKGGWSDEYKTTKLVLRRIGSAEGDSPSDVTVNGDGPSGNVSFRRQTRPSTGFMLDDEEMLSRLERLYGSAKRVNTLRKAWTEMRAKGNGPAVDAIKERYCRRMYNVSQFTKTLKERIAQVVNRRTHHVGHVFEGRFYSGLVERDQMVATMMSLYIDFNPHKAGLVKGGESYAWSSFGQACGSGRMPANAAWPTNTCMAANGLRHVG